MEQSNLLMQIRFIHTYIYISIQFEIVLSTNNSNYYHEEMHTKKNEHRKPYF